MILEVAILDVIPGLEIEFESAFSQAKTVISSASGHVRHELKRCIEKQNRYILLVWWKTLQDHTIGFRKSHEYQEWKRLLHHFYAPFPTVEHYQD